MTLALTTLTKLKTALTISVATHDTYLTDLINRFSFLAERYIGRGDLTSAQVTEGYDGIGQKDLILRRFPVTSIASITIDGTLLDSTEYLLIRDGRNGLVRRKGSGFTNLMTEPYGPVRWPSGGDPERIQVTYTAGYTVAPADLEHACIESCTLWYARRLYGTGYISEALGTYNYTLDKAPVNLGGCPLPIEVISVLASYKEVPIC